MAARQDRTGSQTAGWVQDTLEDMPQAFLACRDMRHQWKPFTAQINDAEGTVERNFRCPRCKTIRHDLLHLRDWTILGTSYTYPDGYLVKGAGRATQDTRALVRRAYTLAAFDVLPVPAERSA